MIVEGEQGGEARAEYGKRVLAELAKRLSTEFGKGFSATNLKLFRQFYLAFPISHTLCDQSGLGRLSWSHFRNLLRVEDVKVRTWYANEAANQGWSVRALDRQISTLFYERLLGSQRIYDRISRAEKQLDAICRKRGTTFDAMTRVHSHGRREGFGRRTQAPDRQGHRIGR